jgi:uncharacterized RDD family membrane protein YckC
MDQSNPPRPPADEPPPPPSAGTYVPPQPPPASQPGPGAYPPPGAGYPPPAGQPWVAPAPAGPAPGIAFAGHGARLGAYVLDVILVGFVATAAIIVLTIILFGSLSFTIDANGDVYVDDTGAFVGAIGALVIGSLLISLFTLLYFPFFWARGGQTPGMRAAGIRVVSDRDGSRIGWGAALLRLIGYWVSGAVFYLGFVWILVDARRRGWHDLIAGTCVVSSR